MNTKPTSNPYQPPTTSGQPQVPVPLEDCWFSGSLPVTVLTCLFVNIVALTVAHSMLNSLLVEFGIELPVFSAIAYFIANHWIAASVVLLLFAVVTIYARTKLDSNNQRRKLIYSTLVSAIWILFTAGLAFAVWHPLHALSTELA